MTTIRNDQPAHEEVRTELGELRKPGDRHNQPGQGADLTPPYVGHLRETQYDRTDAPLVETDPRGGSAPDA